MLRKRLLNPYTKGELCQISKAANGRKRLKPLFVLKPDGENTGANTDAGKTHVASAGVYEWPLELCVLLPDLGLNETIFRVI